MVTPPNSQPPSPPQLPRGVEDLAEGPLPDGYTLGPPHPPLSEELESRDTESHEEIGRLPWGLKQKGWQRGGNKVVRGSGPTGPCTG